MSIAKVWYSTPFVNNNKSNTIYDNLNRVFSTKSKNTSNITIPVAVHQYTQNGSYISESDLNLSIGSMSNFFASNGVNISFTFDDSKHFFKYSNNLFNPVIPPLGSRYTSTTFNLVKNYSKLNPEKFLNIWIVDQLTDTSNDNIPGISSYSEHAGTFVDGIIIDKDFFQTSTLPHEVGHYLSLFHVHEKLDMDNPPSYFLPNNNNCISSDHVHGDLVADTECLIDGSTKGKLIGCSNPPTGCTGNTTYNNSIICGASSINYAILTENIMSYNQCSECRTSLTNGQVNRINHFLTAHRGGLYSGIGSREILNPYGGESQSYTSPTNPSGVSYVNVNVDTDAETFKGGEEMQIIWKDDISSGDVRIYFIDNSNFDNLGNPVTYYITAPTNSSGLEKATWVMPAIDCTGCKIRITESNGTTPIGSDVEFNITTDELLNVTSCPFIQATDAAFTIPFETTETGNVKVELSTDGGNNYFPIDNSFPISGTTNNYNGVINPAWITPNAQMRISLVSNPNIYDISNPFEIICPQSVVGNPTNVPQLSTVNNATDMCNTSGTNVDLLIHLGDATLVSGFYYQWQINGVDAFQNNGENVHVNAYGGGIYTAYMTDGMGCNGAMSNAITITDANCGGGSSSNGSCNPPTEVMSFVPQIGSTVIGWDMVSNAYSYEVRHRQVSTSLWTYSNGFIGGSNTCSSGTCNYTLSNLNSGTNYEFQVRTVCLGGATSVWSGSVSFTTDTVDPNFCNTIPDFTALTGTFDDGASPWLPFGGLYGNGNPYTCPFNIDPVCPNGQVPTQIHVTFDYLNLTAYVEPYNGQRVVLVDNNNTWHQYGMPSSQSPVVYPNIGTPITFNTGSLNVYLYVLDTDVYVGGFEISYTTTCSCNVPSTPTVTATPTPRAVRF